MGLKNSKGEPINEKDKKALYNMLKGSFEEHKARLEKSAVDATEDDFYPPLIGVYDEAIEKLSQRINEAINSKEDISVNEFIDRTFSDISDKTLEIVDDKKADFYEYMEFVAEGFDDKKLMEGLCNKVNEEYKLDKKNTLEGLEETTKSFKFVDKPMPGIENIKEYNPNTDTVKDLYKGRTANSTTLGADIKKLQQELDNLPDAPENENRRVKIQEKIEGFVNGSFGLNAGAEVARIHSSELMAKDKITFGDLLETFTAINEAARPADPGAGKLRGKFVKVSNTELEGVGASVAPKMLYNTLEKISDYMNDIKQTQDPALRKTKAVQLAAFTYQTTLSEHVFGDGNGRTCRLFADTILQTFGLPPHTPTPEELKVPVYTIGNKMDFAAAADAYYKGVQISDATLKKDPEVLKQSRITEMPEKNAVQEKTSTKLSAIYEVDADTIKVLKDLQKQSKKVKSSFKNSEEYIDLCTSIDTCLKLAVKINNNQDNPDFNLKKAEAEYASAVRKMRKAGKDYKDYKMKDHTADKEAEPDKKKLNNDDRKKLSLVESMMKNEKLITVKKPSGGMHR